MIVHSTASSRSSPTTLPEALPLLSVLKALPADSVRSNLVSAFGSRCQNDDNAAPAPIGCHQWLPGQWTPVMYGLSSDWRAFARCVLTETLTVDLAIAVSLQRPSAGGTVEVLESFLAGFPCLQRLTVLAGNGGAPVDDAARPCAPANGCSSTLLDMAEAVSVAHAAQQLLRLDRPEPSAAGQGPRLTSLELRMHPAVWRALRGADPDAFLQRLAAAHPSLEDVTLHVASPLTAGMMGGPASLPSSPDAASPQGSPLTIVGVGPLAALQSLHRLSLGGPIAVEGLGRLMRLKDLSLDGIIPSSSHYVLPALTALTSLRVSDSHTQPIPITAAAARVPAAAATVLYHLRPNLAARGIRSLRLPDVTISAKDWPLLVLLSPHLEELEAANVVPQQTLSTKAAAMQAVSLLRPSAQAAMNAAVSAGSAVPDWFLRATVGDEAAFSTGSAGSTGSNSAGQVKWNGRQPSGTSKAAGEGGGGCPFSALSSSGAIRASSETDPAAAGGQIDLPATSTPVSMLPGLRRLTLWEYVAPPQMVELLQALPDLQSVNASLLLDDPPDVLAAALRPAAVAVLRPLVDVLRSLHDIRMTVSCDPAAVTGQLVCIFLMEAGLAEVPGMKALSLVVWVAAETQLGTLAALSQLRSLELTLGKQEQESELSVLTRLERLAYLSLRITPGIWNEIQGRTGRVSAGAALRLAMSFTAGQVLLLVADVHREICEDEAISLVKSVEMTTGQPGGAWAVSAWVEETAECITAFGPSAGGSATLGGGGGGDGGVLRVVWTPELVRRLLGVVAGVEGRASGGLTVSFMGAEEERLNRVLGS